MEAERRAAARLVVTTRADLVAGLPCPSRDDFEIECRGRQVRVISRGPFWLFGLGGIDVGDGPRVRMAGADREMNTADDVVVGPERVTEYLSTSELLLLTQRRNRLRSR